LGAYRHADWGWKVVWAIVVVAIIMDRVSQKLAKRSQKGGEIACSGAGSR